MKIHSQFFFFMVFLVLSGCLAVTKSPEFTDSSTSSSSSVGGSSEPAIRVIFKNSNFTDLIDFVTTQNTAYRCLGDVLKLYYVNGDDYTGTPTALPTPSAPDTLSPTNKPAFLKNVSVDVTNNYFPTTQPNILYTDTCTYRGTSSAPYPLSCADFDQDRVTPLVTAPLPTVIANPSAPTSPPTTTEYYNTGYYRVRDDWCFGQGPVSNPDPELTKSGVGGVNIDVDRSQLGANEDLLMLVTYHSLNANAGANNWPASVVAGSAHAASDHTILKVNLVGTGQELDALMQVRQPRSWAYSDPTSYPIYLKEIATLEDPLGSLRTEQVYIPLSQNALIDRIRIERVRGSFHLFQIDLYRLGNRAE